MAPELPGYYFDPSKRRYFKIEHSTTAPSTAAWSSDNVKKRKQQDRAASDAEKLLARNKQRISRSRVFKEPTMGGFLSREHGFTDHDVPASSFAQGLLEVGVVPLADDGHPSNSNVKHMHVEGWRNVVTAALDEDSVVTTYIPWNGNRVETRPPDWYRRTANRYSLDVPQISDIARNTHGRGTIIASRQPEADSSIKLCILGDNAYNMHIHEAYYIRNEAEPGYKDPQVNTVASLPGISCEPGAFLAMVGCNRGLYLFACDGVDEEICGHWLTPMRGPTDALLTNPFEDIFSVDFLNYNHRIPLSGGRPGNMFLGDLRTPANKWSYFQHGSVISHIRSLNEHQVLVAGLRSKMSIYDVRFSAKQDATPLVSFPEYTNQAHIHLGLDVEKTYGIVAAAHDDGKVALYSTRSGQRMASPDVDAIASTCGPIHCIQFEPLDRTGDPYEDTPSSLIVGVNSNVHFYSFGTRELDDEA